jgi:hypothetical protein
MMAKDVGGKLLLADASCLSIDPQVAAECPLQVAFHNGKAGEMLLYSLQTDRYHLR